MLELNSQQCKAVHTDGSYTLVLAGAGSGKTRVLTERIIYLIREKKVSPERIMAFTFTNKAAGEMRSRVERVLADRGLSFWIGTFHATGLRILRREARHIGFANNFAIYDEEDVFRLVKHIIRKKGWKLDEYPPAVVRSRISRWKNKLVQPTEALENARDTVEELQAEVYQGYCAELRKNNAFDFDDLITRVVELFTAHPKVKERYARQFKYVLVDEFQDTNTIQMVMIDSLASIHKNLFVVGDDDQAIYGWRGATIDNILQFDRVYPGVDTIRLEENYRSTNTILEAANHLIAHNLGRKGKNLWSRKERGSPLFVYHAEDDRDEAQAVRETIIKLIRGGFKRSEIAVLYRTHAQSRALESALMRGGLPYQIIGGLRFYERREIKDLIGYLKLIDNSRDDVNFRRIINVPRRGIGKVSLARIEENAGEHNLLPSLRAGGGTGALAGKQRERVEEFSKLIASFELLAREATVHEVLGAVVERTGYRDYLREDPQTAQSRLENIEELLNETERFSARGKANGLENFLEEIALFSDIDSLRNEEKVALMTLHNSKGLEYRAVVITGLEEGLLPHYSAYDDDQELEEERRLFYVGMTRAREELYLFCASSRMQFGKWTGNQPSRFLEEIPSRLASVSGWAGSSEDNGSLFREVDPAYAEEDEKVSIRGDSRFREGALINHPTYGEGRIKKVEGSGKDMKVSVQFTGYGTKKFLARYAPFTFRI
ncbi:MAG: UvrD-helicase domain-containing protein [Candidatus Krumholzibacteriota bacterium]|nr:UvrD-helicase domain-containing protein [Candidatus Krumholzibacteriota bacterium]